MKLYKRIVSFLLAVVTCFSFCLTSVFAAWYNDVGYYYTQSSLLQTVFSSLLTVGGTVVGANFGHPYLGELAGSAAAAGIYDLASWLAAGHTEDELYAAEEEFISTLPSPGASSTGLPVYYPSGWKFEGSNYADLQFFTELQGGYSYEAVSTCKVTSYGDPFFPSFTCEPLLHLPYGRYCIRTLSGTNLAPKSMFFYSYRPGGGASTGNAKFSIRYFDSNRTYDGFSITSGGKWSTYFSPGEHFSGSARYIVETLSLVNPSSYTPPEASTRAAAIFQNITNYNSPDNSVNYFIGSLDKKGNIINIYLPDLYEESTKIFTEPVTGNQYQTTGWVYDYISRTYLLSLESGTFLIGSSDIDRIDLTYGDDALTISYYSNGSLITTDSYVYVISEERDCEHDYVSSITTQPTCTSPGLMTYTCSKCGSIYTEELPVVDHICTYSVTKEPSCTDPGTRVGVCSVCGTEVVQDLEPLGHDWLATEHTLTAYNLPPGAACPACRSTDFTSSYSSSSKDFDCTCSDCGKKWIEQAEVSLGKTVYTCSRCGETYTEVAEESSGLFAAIARFISNCIGWVTGKLKDLLHGISGINDVFSDFMISIKEKAKDYPAFLTAAISCLPEDFMSVIWFSIVALIVLAVWKKWLR